MTNYGISNDTELGTICIYVRMKDSISFINDDPTYVSPQNRIIHFRGKRLILAGFLWKKPREESVKISTSKGVHSKGKKSLFEGQLILVKNRYIDVSNSRATLNNFLKEKYQWHMEDKNGYSMKYSKLEKTERERVGGNKYR